jgi:hypothetical protein
MSSHETNNGRKGCGCVEPYRYTLVRLPEAGRSFAMVQQRRARDRRVFYWVVLGYVAAVAAAGACILDSVTGDRFVWGWLVMGALVAALSRTYEVGTVGVRGQLHEAGESACAVEVFEANRIHAKHAAEECVGRPGDRHEEQRAYAEQQRSFWSEHATDLDRFEATLARQQHHTGGS